MNKIVFITCVISYFFIITGCGPAAEDRVKMHETADHIADSISKSIDAALAQGAIPNTVVAPITDTTLKKQQ